MREIDHAFELRRDRQLGIHTCGEDNSVADAHHSPYQPTPYTVLDRLAESGHITRNDQLIDYGCGKGRVSVYMAKTVHCRSIGVEYDESIWLKARENCPKGGRVEFVCASAETFPIPPDANRFYFFNPFSADILRAVLARVIASYYDHPRDIRLIFYYPTAEYLHCVSDTLDIIESIDCRDLFDTHDPAEQILIARVPML